MVYLDVDGVVSDFRKAWTGLTDYVWEQPRGQFVPMDIWSINQNDIVCMYEFMPLLDHGRDLLWLASVNNWRLLTAVPDTQPLAQQARLRWLEHLGYYDVQCCFAEDKSVYAGTDYPNILVDDAPHNINAWEAKGGYAIYYHLGESISFTELLELIEQMTKQSVIRPPMGFSHATG